MSYKFSEFQSHTDQELADALRWHDSLNHFKTDKEREAYVAGFAQGKLASVKMLRLHGGLTLSEWERGQTETA